MTAAGVMAQERNRRALPAGLVLAVALTLLAAVPATGQAGGARQSALEPCPKPPPAQRYDGEGTLVMSGGVKKALRRAGVRQRMVRPANSFTGRPTYPVRDAGLAGRRSTVSLRGGFRLVSRPGGALVVSKLRAVLPKGSRKVNLNGIVNGTRMRVFTASAAKVRLNPKAGLLNLRGADAKLSAKASKRFRRVLGLRGVKRLAPGKKWGRLAVFAARNDRVEDPVAETPVEPPFLERPPGAADITSATIKWRVRESFIRYVAVGAGTSVSDGATADPPEQIGGTAPLTYSFNFQFSDGWSAAGPGPTAIHGSGKVGFRYCTNTINFTVAEPEIELNGDSDSRLIFRVDGTDGTAFPDSRAVMVQLIPSEVTPVTEGDTTTWTAIPGYIPQAATGIFADFYPPFPGSTDIPGAELSRFGSVTVSYSTG